MVSLQPFRLVTIRVTVKVPGVEKIWVGSSSVLKFRAPEVGSPKFQSQAGNLSAQVFIGIIRKGSRLVLATGPGVKTCHRPVAHRYHQLVKVRTSFAVVHRKGDVVIPLRRYTDALHSGCRGNRWYLPVSHRQKSISTAAGTPARRDCCSGR